MKKESWIVASHVLTSVAKDTETNYSKIRKGYSGIMKTGDLSLGLINDVQLSLSDNQSMSLTLFERFIHHSIEKALLDTSIDPSSKNVLFVLSTTKGNINLIDEGALDERLLLYHSAQIITRYFRNPNKAVVVSNACVSGVTSLIVARRQIASGLADHVIICGADLVSNFVKVGFKSLDAISSDPCQPYDKNRSGISLGEGVGTIILSKNRNVSKNNLKVKIIGEGLSNDANHISGPSRTGKPLAKAVMESLRDAMISSSKLGFISAHGTGTVFNDEMESKAFNLCNLSETPLNSLKGSVGHTLGASGIIESVLSIESLLNEEVLPTVGFSELGVPEPLSVSSFLKKIDSNFCLKTASGFGGSNAAIIFKNMN